uniref:Uncharacterized protein n=1 Tax=Alexandrium monilatum TaxID=311494 RepID=A0A7S4RZR7_9DINO
MDAAAQDYTVLGEPAEAAPPTGRALRWRVALVASALSGVVFLAAAAAARQPAHHVALAPLGPLPVAAPGLRAAGALNASAAVDLAAGYTRECWTYTGGTCNVQECKAYRKAVCTRSGVFKLCTCGSGCAGADTACHPERNKLVAEDIPLESAYYPGYYLRVPTTIGFSQVRVSRTLDDAARFSLWRVPGEADGVKRYLIGPKEYPDYVLEVANTGQLIGSDFKVIDSDPSSYFSFSGGSANPAFTFWDVCKVNGHVRLGAGISSNLLWAYSHMGTWLIYAWDQAVWGSPDERAEWKVDASVLEALDDC